MRNVLHVCELYCAGHQATQHQVGWWPDTFACDDCRIQWDLLCNRSDGCRELAEWHLIGPACANAQVADCRG